MQQLGRVFDISPAIVPVDISAGAVTGKRVSMRDARIATLVLFKGLEAGTDDPVLTFQQHKLNTGGTPINLAVVTNVWQKAAVTLAGTETWTAVPQAASQTVTLTSQAPNQGIYVVEITADSLADGYKYISVNSADAGSTAQLAGALWFLGDREVQRRPSNMQPTLHA